MTAPPRARYFLETLARFMRCDPSVVGEIGVTVRGHPDRADNHVSAGYRLGEHFVITCDPMAEAMLQSATADMAPTFDAWAGVAAELQGELLGAGRMQLLASDDVARPDLPTGYAYRSLHRDDAADVALISRLVDESSAEDLDESEVGVDDLDDMIEVVVDAEGRIAGFASAGPFAMALPFGDISVLTHERARGIGVGAAVVASMCRRIQREGLEPLYRCDDTNEGSVRLSARVGFTPVTQLVAYRFPTDQS